MILIFYSEKQLTYKDWSYISQTSAILLGTFFIPSNVKTRYSHLNTA